MKTFVCYYCVHKTDDYRSMVEHHRNNHQSDIFKFRQIELGTCSGNLGYRTKIARNKIHLIDCSSSENLNSHPEYSEPLFLENDTTTTSLISPLDKRQLNNSNRNDNYGHCPKSSELIQDTNINNDEDDDFDEIQSSLPAVIETLREHGQLDLYKKWCHLLAKNSSQWKIYVICCF